MQAILRRLLPGAVSGAPVEGDSDYKGFELADRIEDGDVHEMLPESRKPIPQAGQYLLRKGGDLNEWSLLDYRTMKFMMRGVIEVELDGKFTSGFDAKVLASQKTIGRMRVGLYLHQASDPSLGSSDPVVAMISDPARSSFKAFKVVCDSCRYQRRRSSFTEGMDFSGKIEMSQASPTATGQSSACSNYSSTNQQDFGSLCSITPSSQEILRMRHDHMKVHGRDFARIHLVVPKEGTDWCPIAHPNRKALGERNKDIDPSFDSKLPVWSESLKALALEFRHREVFPSRRNFQLVVPEDSHPVCQYYRSGKSEYMLEMKPGCELSLVQGFLVALSSTFWN
jgi:hypothetical protein